MYNWFFTFSRCDNGMVEFENDKEMNSEILLITVHFACLIWALLVVPTLV